MKRLFCITIAILLMVFSAIIFSSSQVFASEKPFRVAVCSTLSPQEVFRYYRDIIDYIGQKLDAEIELVQRGSFENILGLLEREELDIGFVCSGPYVEGHDRFGLEMIAAPEMNGKSVYYAYIIVHKDAEIDEFKDLKGKTFAFVDPLSHTGTWVPVHILSKMNETPDTFFKKCIYTHSCGNSIEAVAKKIVDGASVSSYIWDYYKEKGGAFSLKTKVVEKSQPYGIPPVVVRPGLDPILKKKFSNILLNMHQNTAGKEILSKIGIDRFVLPSDSSYDTIREVRKYLDIGKEERKKCCP